MRRLDAVSGWPSFAVLWIRVGLDLRAVAAIVHHATSRQFLSVAVACER